MTLSWAAVAGVNGYEIEIEDANNSAAYKVEFPVSGTPFTAGLPYAGNFKFKVKSRCGNGMNSDYTAYFPFGISSLQAGDSRDKTIDANTVPAFSVFPQPAGEVVNLQLESLIGKD